MPTEAVDEMASKRPPKTQTKKRLDRSTESSEASKKVLGLSDPRAEAAAKAKAVARTNEKAGITMSASTLAQLRAQSAATRHAALAHRPRSLPEIAVAARTFGVNLIENPQLVWLVSLVLSCDHMTLGWDTVPRDMMARRAHAVAERHHHSETAHPQISDSILSLIAQPSIGGAGGFGPSPVKPPMVVWLPPIERLWHVASKNEEPSQYAMHMCGFSSERHPLSSFMRAANGINGFSLG